MTLDLYLKNIGASELYREIITVDLTNTPLGCSPFYPTRPDDIEIGIAPEEMRQLYVYCLHQTHRSIDEVIQDLETSLALMERNQTPLPAIIREDLTHALGEASDAVVNFLDLLHGYLEFHFNIASEAPSGHVLRVRSDWCVIWCIPLEDEQESLIQIEAMLANRKHNR